MEEMSDEEIWEQLETREMEATKRWRDIERNVSDLRDLGSNNVRIDKLKCDLKRC